MISVITIDREYGSGAPAISRRLADGLGWKLWDELLSREIARLTDSDLAAVKQREERKDPLYYRLFKSFLRGSYEATSQVPRLGLLDADRIVAITKRVVLEAAAGGRCVIVGRGAQYFLEERAEAYHVFTYAPYEEKLRREREAGRSAEEARRLVGTVDRDRAAFIQTYFAKEWPTRHLYHLMINSKIGDEAVVETIVHGMETLARLRTHVAEERPSSG